MHMHKRSSGVGGTEDSRPCEWCACRVYLFAGNRCNLKYFVLCCIWFSAEFVTIAREVTAEES